MSEIPTQIIPLLFMAGFMLVIIICAVALLKAYYVKVDQGTALIVNGMSEEPKVYFSNALVLPIISNSELVTLTIIPLVFDCRDSNSLLTSDNLRADMIATFYLRINENPLDVLKAAKSVGASRTADRDTVSQLFRARFSESLKVVCRQLTFASIFDNTEIFRHRILEYIGEDLNGYVLEDMAIDCELPTEINI